MNSLTRWIFIGCFLILPALHCFRIRLIWSFGLNEKKILMHFIPGVPIDS